MTTAPINLDLIVDLPSEDRDQALETVAYCRDLPAKVYEVHCTDGVCRSSLTRPYTVPPMYCRNCGAPVITIALDVEPHRLKCSRHNVYAAAGDDAPCRDCHEPWLACANCRFYADSPDVTHCPYCRREVGMTNPTPANIRYRCPRCGREVIHGPSTNGVVWVCIPCYARGNTVGLEPMESA